MCSQRRNPNDEPYKWYRNYVPPSPSRHLDDGYPSPRRRGARAFGFAFVRASGVEMSSKQTLMVAVALGVVAALFAGLWFRGKEKALEGMSAPAPALVAAQYIASGARIDRTLVEVKQVPRAFIQPGALRSVEEAEGQVALAPIAPGEQIIANKLTTTGVALALAVPPGKRAVTVAVDESAGVAGLLKPGDLVDVFVTVEEGTQPKTYVLMQVAPVLAVGRTFSAKPAAEEKEGVFGRVDEGTVTLAALPYEAEQLTHLEQVGRLKLVLRAPGDREKIPLPAITGRSAGKAASVSEDGSAARRR